MKKCVFDGNRKCEHHHVCEERLESPSETVLIWKCEYYDPSKVKGR